MTSWVDRVRGKQDELPEMELPTIRQTGGHPMDACIDYGQQAQVAVLSGDLVGAEEHIRRTIATAQMTKAHYLSQAWEKAKQTVGIGDL